MSPTSAPYAPSDELQDDEDVEKPLPFRGDESSKPGEVKSSPTSSKPADALATAGEVFSFMPDLQTKVYFGAGVVCASISGCIFPAMAFLLSNSFEDLSGSTSKYGNSNSAL